MAYKIRLETDNATRPGFVDAARGLQVVGDQVGITANAVKDLSKELDKRHWAEYRAQVRAAADALDGVTLAKKRAAEAAKQMAEQAKLAAKQMADADREAAEQIRNSQQTHQAGLHAVVDVYRMVGDAIKFMAEQTRQAAAEGSVNAQKMVDGFDGLAAKLREVVYEGEAMTNAIEAAGDVSVQGPLVEYATTLSDRFADAQEAHQRMVIAVMYGLGQIDEQLAKDEFKSITRQHSAEEREKKRRERSREAEEKLAKDNAKAVEDAEDAMVRAAAERDRKQRADEEKASQQAARDSQELLKQITEMHIRAEREIQAEQQRTFQSKQRQMAEEVAAARAKAAAERELLRKGGGDQVAQQLVSGVDQRKVREEFAKQRMALAAANIDSGNFGEFTKGDRARMIQEARNDAFRQFNRGEVGAAEMGSAVSSVVKGQMGQAKLTGNMAQALGEAVDFTVQVKQEQDQLNQSVNQIRRQIQAGASNNRYRAQRGP